MNTPSDDQITNWARKIRRSDQRAFDQLFRSLYPVLIRFACRYTGDRTAAEDIVQNSFVILWQKRSRIDPKQSLKSYMYKIVRNRALNYIRDNSQMVSNQVLIDEQHQAVADAASSENAESLENQFSNWIDELPDRQKEAFELSRFDGLNHREIAGVMDVSVKTVNNHIVAALRYLRKCYNQYQQQDSRKEDV